MNKYPFDKGNAETLPMEKKRNKALERAERLMRKWQDQRICLKAKTCKHAVKFTGNQGLFVRTTCKCPNKLMLPVPDKRGIRVKVPYIMAKKCINCKGYIDARKVKEKRK